MAYLPKKGLILPQIKGHETLADYHWNAWFGCGGNSRKAHL
jgi:hypothetical protein